MTLWIDAICINQDDHKEKQKQVQLMREIYFCSNRLIVWLESPSGDALWDLRKSIEGPSGEQAAAVK